MVATNNAIFNTVGASISGVTNTLTITNPSNTASSAARESITVGGGSAGDPTINWNVAGITDWEMGIDNSVSDNLTISQGTALGTNDVWRMTKAGIRTMPLQPAFFCYFNAATAAVTGDSTNYSFLCDTILYDQASNVVLNSGGKTVFTAPITGIYRFECMANMSNITVAQTGSQMQIVTTNNPININCGSAANQRDNLGNLSSFFTGVLPMNIGDTASIVLQVKNGTKSVVVNGIGGGFIRSWFSGFLLY